MARERILVTAALPYANGPLHVGHAIGAYIPADVYVRYNRLKGNDVVFVGGTDEHGTPIAVAAEKEGITPKDMVDRFHKDIKASMVDLGISFDNFSRTSTDMHYKLAQEFFLEISKKGFVYKKTVERPFCSKCGRFLPDRFVKGTCPQCGSRDERGDQCEKCGKQLEPHELKEPYCIICRAVPEMRKTEHWFFKLSEFSDKLGKWIEKNTHWPDNARNFSLGWIREGLSDRAITRDLGWGVPVPVKGVEGKVLYVWFDAPIGYISATGEWSLNIGKRDEWKKYWMRKAKIVHFLGKDNIPFHTIIWPAMLMAHEGFNLPWQISSNEYLTLEGQKMSTSRNWVLWVDDCLSEFDPDQLRYYLLSINPERHDSDFSLKEFQHKVNNELIATFGNFVHRSLTFIEKNGSKLPEVKEFDSMDEKMIKVIRDAPDRVGKHLDKFRFLDALKEVMALAQFGNEYFQKKEPWKNENTSTLYLCANYCRTLAILSYPFMPFTAEMIWRMLGLKDSAGEQDWITAAELGMPEGHRIKKITPLFEKIEDEDIDAFEKKFLKKKPEEEKTKKDKGAKKPEKKEEPAEETACVEFERFREMDLRIGRINEVKDHPKADKLYILKVDLGALGERQIVAGIKGAYDKKDLVGREVVVVANLKPAELRGQRSEGMLLAADLEGVPVLLAPAKEVNPGSRVR